MFINQEFINNLSSVEVVFIRIGIDKLFKEKVTREMTNYENEKMEIKCIHAKHAGNYSF